ncbi:MAG TPA: phosphatase PAP2/dual specificity phosphatase family protein [Enterobacteriaceae bacterium]|nr:phosphatase PAP2/dual specificity phosphatase family protein [Enterobacteriaceae bacterium]
MTTNVFIPGAPGLWKRAVLWLLLLAPLFFISYGQVNHFTATRADVQSVVFAWEHRIPFIPWTIIPYWSIDLLYGISLLVCTSRRELDRHALRLVAASLVACVGFLLFPLQFTFQRPETSGVAGLLFRQLEQFDLPYNQAPSLHIILAWLLWLRFRAHLSAGWRNVSTAWFVLIGLSVLTTWQHHVIDVYSGLIVGVIISYLLPISWQGRGRGLRPPHYGLAKRYGLGGLLFFVAGLFLPYGYLLFWPALAMAIVACGYLGLREAVWQKDSTGHISLSAWILLLPVIVGAHLSRRYFCRRLSPVSEISEGVAIGYWPVSIVTQASVLDLTAEFNASPAVKGRPGLCYPLLDLTVPDRQQLQEAVETLRHLHLQHGSVLVHCALGLSRSALVVAAWLMTAKGLTAAQAVDTLRARRPEIVLSAAHIALLEALP